MSRSRWPLASPSWSRVHVFFTFVLCVFSPFREQFLGLRWRALRGPKPSFSTRARVLISIYAYIWTVYVRVVCSLFPLGLMFADFPIYYIRWRGHSRLCFWAVSGRRLFLYIRRMCVIHFDAVLVCHLVVHWPPSRVWHAVLRSVALFFVRFSVILYV
jgi:hypothetical protein